MDYGGVEKNIIKIYHLSSQITNIICCKRGESEKELLLCLFTVIINTRKQSSVHKKTVLIMSIPSNILVSFYSLCNCETLVCLCKNHRFCGKIFIQNDSFQRGFLFTFNKFHETLFCFLSNDYYFFLRRSLCHIPKVPYFNSRF